VETWLITPQFSTADAVTVTFYARADLIELYFDQIAFGVNFNGTTTTADFEMQPFETLGGVWTLFTVNIAAQGVGTSARFAIEYAGNQIDTNYIGVDTLTIESFPSTEPAPVPEPSTYAMLLGGLGLLGFMARRRCG
jgi:hypothetical protein